MVRASRIKKRFPTYLYVTVATTTTTVVVMRNDVFIRDGYIFVSNGTGTIYSIRSPRGDIAYFWSNFNSEKSIPILSTQYHVVEAKRTKMEEK